MVTLSIDLPLSPFFCLETQLSGLVSPAQLLS
uniref:Uncharacterized protein n=1 Tax=Arundo donax TaxID=35708 RepID=A0A0A8Z0S0_ARUDO